MANSAPESDWDSISTDDSWDEVSTLDDMATRENRARRDEEWEQVFKEWEMVKQSGVSQDQHWEGLIAEHQKNVQADAQSEAAILDEIIKNASAESIPDLQELKDKFQAEQAEQQRVLDLIIRDTGTSAERMSLEAEAQSESRHEEDFERMVTERELMKRSAARQDAIWKQFFERRKGKASPKKSQAPDSRLVPMRQLEEKLRGLRLRERIAGQMSSDAAAGGDKAAWGRAQKIIDKLYDEREVVRGKIKKLDPKREEALYEELYLR